MVALASIEQLEARLGRQIADADEPRAQALLDDASASVRSYTGQTFTVATTTDRLAVVECWVNLPQRPVTDVSDVTDDAGNPVGFTWAVGAQRVCLDLTPVGSCGRPYATVTNTHGYDVMPDDIVAVVCNVAGRSLGHSVTEAAVASQSIAGYQESFGPVGAAGPIGLFTQETAVLDRYRRVGTTAWARVRV